MALSSSYAPDESQSAIIQEEAWLQGTLLSNLFFGIEIMLCVLAFLAIRQRGTSKHNRVLLIYIFALFAIIATSQGLLLEWIQMGFITQRNYPGGPTAFFNDEWSIPESLAETILVVFANWMMESLLVWRCHVVCSAGRRYWWLGTAIPFGFLIVVFATGGLFIWKGLHGEPPTIYVLAYSVSSLALNITATVFIAGRLLVYRHHVVSQFGRGYGNQYVGIAAVVVESAAIYTAFLLIVIVAYALGSPATNLLQQVIWHVQSITSLLIIWRITRGEGWTKSTGTEEASAAVSSNTSVGLRSGPNVIQLELARTKAVEGSSRQKGNDSKVWSPKGGEV